MEEEIQRSESTSQGRQAVDRHRQTVIVNHSSSQSNGVGTAGFVLAIIAVFLGWIPVLGWFLFVLGLILSFAGMFKKPRGLAVAGFIVSLIDLILLLTVFAAVAGTAAGLGALFL